MKKILVSLLFCIFINVFCIAKENAFVEYTKLSPEINKLSTLPEYNKPSKPVIWIERWPGEFKTIEYNTVTKETSYPDYSDLKYFSWWDPIKKRNVLEISSSKNNYNFEYLKYYEFFRNPETGKYSYKKLTNNEEFKFNEIHWISESSFFINDKYKIMAMKSSPINIIRNIDNNREINFSPEQIIGYGKGMIITSKFEETGFKGLSLWTEKGEIVYKDSNFDIGKINKEKWDLEYQHVIFNSFYLYPYIFLNLGAFWGQQVPTFMLLIDLESNRVYKSLDYYHLLAVFDN